MMNTTELSDQQIEGLRAFDYAEQPIKEWIAEFLGENPNTIFDDYKEDSSDVMGFQVKDKYYVASLNCYEGDMLYNADISEMYKSRETLINAVFTVYPAVVKTMTHMNHKMSMLMPKFDPEKNCFSFTPVNQIAMEKYALTQALGRIFLEKDKYEGDDLKQIVEAETKARKRYSEITDAMIKEKDAECEKLLPMIDKSLKLYISFDENSITDLDNELKMKRLPQFGMTYQDPDEKNYIDKLKDEYKIQS